MALWRVLVLNKCGSATPRRRQAHSPYAKKQKKAREGAETPAEPLWRFPRFLSRAALIYFVLFALPFADSSPHFYMPSLTRSSRTFSCGTFIFQVSRFLRPFSKDLQKKCSKNLRISLLLTTGNDFFHFLNGKICRCFCILSGFPFFSADIFYHIFSNPVRTFTDTFPSQKVH